MLYSCVRVALRKESVDRNYKSPRIFIIGINVALRKESVDRNGLGVCHYRDDVPSLSARRAWIEIDFSGSAWVPEFTSLSARRAWIEIASRTPSNCFTSVALRKESVDRNVECLALDSKTVGRSPQGERG